MEPPTFIATVRLDDDTSRRLNLLRRKYFPPDRNFLDAHVILFHKLSVEALFILENAVAEFALRTFEASVAGPFSLGRGVAIRVESNDLISLRKQLVARLNGELTAQDRQGYRPHVTIQNKVTAEDARECLIAVRTEWLPCVAEVEGIDLWEYLGGPWRHHARLVFQA